jgi:Ca2+-transporting ATPase
VPQTFDLHTFTGLSAAEAATRLAAEGYNELPGEKRRNVLNIALEVAREPMFLLLVAAGAIYLALGDAREALMLLGFVFVVMGITIYEERKTERVLEALRDLTSPRALVVRDGEKRRTPGREVVRGDLLLLAEGDRVPADAVLLVSNDLMADESLLTGESVSVRKSASDGKAPMAAPGGDDLPFVYSGSMLVQGQGVAEVRATGARSEIGKIGHALREIEVEVTPLQKETRKLVRNLAWGGAVLCVVVVVIYGLTRGDWLGAVLAGITLAMSILPEEFPVVLTVFMAMGAWRISHARVLTRRASAIETLGSASVLCTDKTGTLTENRMSIAELRLQGGNAFPVKVSGSLPAGFHEILRIGILASAAEPFDPMERAFHESGRLAFEGKAETRRLLVRAYGLRAELLAVTQVWRDDDGLIVAAKGAPEAIADLCRASADELAALKASADAMANDGLRVLAVARARVSGEDLPDDPHGFAFEYLGLVGLADPLRASVRDAVAECRSAGIRVVMITGDYPTTARAIAKQAGLDSWEIMTGEDLQSYADAELAEHVKTVTVFARIMPEQKLRIVNALKANGEIVAMTGDGVNDAPSLKAAHIGIAMGGRGTDVAREASSIVLLDDDFGSVIKAIRLGRRIYDNLRKAMGFIFAVHVPIAGLALLPLVFGLPIIFSPIHIAFLEMVIDPVCTLVFEAETEEEDIMHRPPRPTAEPLFSWRLISWGLLQGLLTFTLVGTIFVIASKRGMPADEVRALAFFSLVLSIVSLILVNRSFSTSFIMAIRRPNTMLAWILAIVFIILTLSLMVPAVRDLFRFGPLHIDDIGLSLGAAAVVLLVLELAKTLWRDQLRY